MTLEGVTKTAASLAGKRVAVLAENDYEDLELWYPVLRLREAGAEVVVVGTGSSETYASKHGYPVKVDVTADKIGAKDFAAVVVPGGWAPDKLRRYPAVTKFVRDIFEQGKVVAAICHGGSVLVSAGILTNRTMTCVPAIKDDVVYAGAKYVDQEVVVDGNLITSRVPGDLPAFCRAIVAALGEQPLQKLNAQQALEVAIASEKAAYAFYVDAVQRVGDAEGRAMFDKLAQQEAGHRAALEAELHNLLTQPGWRKYALWREYL